MSTKDFGILLFSSDFSLTKTTCCAVAVALYTAWKLWQQQRNNSSSRKPFADLPTLPNSHWLYGHFRDIFGLPMPVAYKLMEQAADNAGRLGIFAFASPMLYVLDARDAQRILRAEHVHNFNAVLKQHFVAYTGPYSIVVLNDRLWKIERAIMHKALVAILPQLPVVVTRVAQTLVTSLESRLREEQNVNTKDGSVSLTMNIESLMKMVTLDVFGLLALGYSFENAQRLKESPVSAAFNFLGSELSRRLSTNPIAPSNFWYTWPNAANRKFAAQKRVVRNIVQNLITDKRKQREGRTTIIIEMETSQCSPQNVLDSLIQGHDALKQENDEEALKGVDLDHMLHNSVVSLLFAGYDTTSIALTYALYMVSQHPNAEARCLEEIREVMVHDEVSRQRKIPNADQLVYCRAFVKETLRLYPPAFNTVRSMRKSLTLPGYSSKKSSQPNSSSSSSFTIPKNTLVGIPIWQIHRSERNFVRPLEFHPERWASYDTSSNTWKSREYDTEQKHAGQNDTIPAGNPAAFFAFSSGARDCVGQDFAWNESTILFAYLLDRFCFASHEDTQRIEADRSGPVQRPIGGLSLQIRLRYN